MTGTHREKHTETVNKGKKTRILWNERWREKNVRTDEVFAHISSAPLVDHRAGARDSWDGNRARNRNNTPPYHSSPCFCRWCTIYTPHTASPPSGPAHRPLPIHWCSLNKDFQITHRIWKKWLKTFYSRINLKRKRLQMCDFINCKKKRKTGIWKKLKRKNQSEKKRLENVWFYKL